MDIYVYWNVAIKMERGKKILNGRRLYLYVVMEREDWRENGKR